MPRIIIIVLPDKPKPKLKKPAKKFQTWLNAGKRVLTTTTPDGRVYETYAER